MPQSISVVDETNSYQMLKWTQKIMWFHILLARNKIFPFLHWYQSPAMSNQSMQSWTSYWKLWNCEIASTGHWKFKAMPDNVLENCCLKAWFNLTLTSTFSSTQNMVFTWLGNQIILYTNKRKCVQLTSLYIAMWISKNDSLPTVLYIISDTWLTLQ